MWWTEQSDLGNRIEVFNYSRGCQRREEKTWVECCSEWSTAGDFYPLYTLQHALQCCFLHSSSKEILSADCVLGLPFKALGVNQWGKDTGEMQEAGVLLGGVRKAGNWRTEQKPKVCLLLFAFNAQLGWRCKSPLAASGEALTWELLTSRMSLETLNPLWEDATVRILFSID